VIWIRVCIAIQLEINSKSVEILIIAMFNHNDDSGVNTLSLNSSAEGNTLYGAKNPLKRRFKGCD
jgi:hypothetical protein